MKIIHIFSGVYTGGGIIKKIINLKMNDPINEHVLYFFWYADPLNKRFSMMKYLEDLHINYEYTYKIRIWQNIPYLYHYLKESNCDLVHFYTDNIMVIGKIVQMLGIKHRFVRSFEGAPMYPNFPKKQLANWALSSCKNFVSISEYVKNTYLSLYSSLKGTNQTVVYNALVHNLQRHKTLAERKGILCVGTLTDQKQFDVAIKAIAILKSKYKKLIPLYILGEGSDKDKLKALTKELDVECLVHFEGVIINPEPYYDKCKLFIHPAYNEGFGLVLLEAMTMELGIIVSDSGALPEIIEDGNSGYILPLKSPEIWADKINEFYYNDSLVESMGKRAHEIAINKFSEEKHIQGYINFYNNAAK